MIRKSVYSLAVMALILAVPAVAGAHVEITGGAPGTDDELVAEVFVEAECPSYTATAELVFPETPELTIATPAVIEGWTAAVAKRDGSEAVASVTWTNTGQVAGDGEFRLALGPIATDGATIDFKAIQTCDDGEVLRWIEEGADGEFPAPVLTLDHGGASGEGHHAEPSTEPKPAPKLPDDDSSIGVIVGVVAGVAALAGGLLVIARRKK